MNGSQMLDIMGLIDPAFIEEAETASACAEPARVSVFKKRPWVKWAAAAAAVLIVAAGAPGAIYMMRNFGSGGFVDPNGSVAPGIVSPADGGSSVPSGEGEAQGGSDAESGSKPKAPDSSVAHGNESSSAAPGGNKPANDPGTITSDASSSDITEGEFIKDNMPAVSYRINGSSKTFEYENSFLKKVSPDKRLEGEVSYYVIDNYVAADGSTVSKNADSPEFMQYVAPESTLLHLQSSLSVDKAVDKAKQIVTNSNIFINGLENSEISLQTFENRYLIIIKAADSTVSVKINFYGDLMSISVEKN